MKETNDYEKDLASIRSIMERSVKFISLSGISGVLAGIYAMVGAMVAYKILYDNTPPYGYDFHFGDPEQTILQLSSVALVVLFLSIVTAIIFSFRLAHKKNVPLWGPSSQQLLTDVAIPLMSGGLLILIMMAQGYFGFVAPATLIFYGLALMAGGRHTFAEIRYLGLSEIILGLLCALLPGFGLVFWAIGFGILHIIYGSIMHFRHNR